MTFLSPFVIGRAAPAAATEVLTQFLPRSGWRPRIVLVRDRAWPRFPLRHAEEAVQNRRFGIAHKTGVMEEIASDSLAGSRNTGGDPGFFIYIAQTKFVMVVKLPNIH
jgi:hypothetical protein